MERYGYPIVVYEERAAEGPLWIGNFPGLNGCWVEGSSKEDVLARAPYVIHEFAAACRELGWEETRGEKREVQSRKHSVPLRYVYTEAGPGKEVGWKERGW